MTLVSVVGAFCQPVNANPFREDYTNPPMFTACYHEYDGVLASSPFTFTQGGATCPPCSSNASCMAEHQQIDNYKSLNGLPPHLCREKPVHEW